MSGKSVYIWAKQAGHMLVNIDCQLDTCQLGKKKLSTAELSL